MDTRELTTQMLQTVRELRKSCGELEDRSYDFARSERAYRVHKAKAYLQSTGRNISEREADAESIEIDGRTLSDARYARDLAEGLKVSALEAVRSNRGIVSALQSLAALERSEAELAKWAPDAAGS